MPGDWNGGEHPNDPFDAWLDRGLRALYNPVLFEQVPDHLLDLIRRDLIQHQIHANRSATDGRVPQDRSS